MIQTKVPPCSCSPALCVVAGGPGHFWGALSQNFLLAVPATKILLHCSPTSETSCPSFRVMFMITQDMSLVVLMHSFYIKKKYISFLFLNVKVWKTTQIRSNTQERACEGEWVAWPHLEFVSCKPIGNSTSYFWPEFSYLLDGDG